MPPIIIISDVFLVCNEQGTSDKFYQIWLNDKSNGFTLSQVGKLPSGVQAISFADMDRDGTMDMVFATCASVSSSTGIGADCAINIAYNKQLPLCASSTSSPVKNGRTVCRRPEQLCTADPDFQFDLTGGTDSYVY